ncbi:MAG: hypothetical protein LC792_04520 [Actinobacteria bacterium]|nr:hypothetical protein [Actinomycetota bacterium]
MHGLAARGVEGHRVHDGRGGVERSGLLQQLVGALGVRGALAEVLGRGFEERLRGLEVAAVRETDGVLLGPGRLQHDDLLCRLGVGLMGDGLVGGHEVDRDRDGELLQRDLLADRGVAHDDLGDRRHPECGHVRHVELEDDAAGLIGERVAGVSYFLSELFVGFAPGAGPFGGGFRSETCFGPDS